ncbi:unnamed protein product [Amoebophrya sp. A25]|nr:unnamed protein product [Amoebophrya sp. A25]|eukprot:GSA25T00001416001.1
MENKIQLQTTTSTHQKLEEKMSMGNAVGPGGNVPHDFRGSSIASFCRLFQQTFVL